MSSSGRESIFLRLDHRLAALEARLGPLARLCRYYMVAAVNTAFGYGVFAAFIALGVNIFIAQILSQILGMTFNFFTYRRHVFRTEHASTSAYIAAYVLNYLIGLGLLGAFHSFGWSPYVSGLGALLGASLINFFVLKRLVFRPVSHTGPYHSR